MNAVFADVRIEPGSVYCTACGSDLVDGPGCAMCGERDDWDWDTNAPLAERGREEGGTEGNTE